MRRNAGRWTIVIGLVCVATHIALERHAAPPGSVATNDPARGVSRAPHDPVLQAPEPRELALFHEILKARDEAGIREPGRGRSGAPATTTPSHKSGAKMEREARRRFAKVVANVAQAHGITPEEIEEIYRRGREGEMARATVTVCSASPTAAWSSQSTWIWG